VGVVVVADPQPVPLGEVGGVGQVAAIDATPATVVQRDGSTRGSITVPTPSAAAAASTASASARPTNDWCAVGAVSPAAASAGPRAAAYRVSANGSTRVKPRPASRCRVPGRSAASASRTV
jgi:hypothetical protein